MAMGGVVSPRRRRRRSLLATPLLLILMGWWGAAAVADGGSSQQCSGEACAAVVDGEHAPGVNLLLKMDRGLLRDVSSGSVRYSKLELTNTDEEDTLIIHSMRTALPDAEPSSSDGDDSEPERKRDQLLQIHVSHFADRTLTLKPGQAVVVPVTFFPQFDRPPPVRLGGRGDFGGEDGAYGAETQAAEDAFWAEFTGSNGGADLADLITGGGVGRTPPEKGGLGLIDEPKPELLPDPLPPLDLSFGSRDRVTARATLRIETSRGAATFPLEADAVRRNAYNVPDAAYFRWDGWALSSYLTGAAGGGAEDSLRFRSGEMAAPLGPDFKKGTKVSGGFLGQLLDGEGVGSGRYEYDLYLDNPHLTEEMRIVEMFSSDPDLVTIEHGHPDFVPSSGAFSRGKSHRPNNCHEGDAEEMKYCDKSKNQDSSGPVIIPATGKRAYVGTVRVVTERFGAVLKKWDEEQNFDDGGCNSTEYGGGGGDYDDLIVTYFLGHVHIRTNMENFTVAVHGLWGSGDGCEGANDSDGADTAGSDKQKQIKSSAAEGSGSGAGTLTKPKDNAPPAKGAKISSGAGSLEAMLAPVDAKPPQKKTGGGGKICAPEYKEVVPLLSSTPRSASFGSLTSPDQAAEVAIDVTNHSPNEVLKLMRVTVSIDPSAGPNGNSEATENGDVGLRVDVRISGQTTPTARPGPGVDVFLQPNGGTARRAIILTARSHSTGNATHPARNFTDAEAARLFPRTYRGTIVLRAGPVSQNYDNWKRSVAVDPNSDYHRSTLLEIPFTAQVLHGRVSYSVNDAYFPAEPGVDSPEAKAGGLLRHLYLVNAFPVSVQIKGLRVDGDPTYKTNPVLAFMSHFYCRQMFRPKGTDGAKSKGRLTSAAEPRRKFENLGLLYVFRGHDQKFPMNGTGFVTANGVSWEADATEDKDRDPIGDELAKGARKAMPDDEMFEATDMVFLYKFPKTCSLVLETDEAGEVSVPLTVYSGLLESEPETRAVPPVCSPPLSVRSSSDAGGGGRPARAEDTSSKASTSSRTSNPTDPCLQLWYESTPQGRALENHIDGVLEAVATDTDRGAMQVLSAYLRVSSATQSQVIAHNHGRANDGEAVELAAPGGMTFPLNKHVDPLLVSAGSIPAGSSETVSVYLHNRNPTPIKVAPLVHAVEGASIRLGRRPADRLMNQVLTAGGMGGGGSGSGSGVDDDAHGAMDSARAFLGGLAYQDDISPSADASDDLLALYKLHSRVRLHRDEDSSQNLTTAASSSPHSSADAGEEGGAGVAHQSVFSCFEPEPDESDGDGVLARAWQRVRGGKLSSEPILFGGVLLSADGAISCRLPPIPPPNTSSSSSSSYQPQDHSSWTLPPGSTARFEVTVHSPPASAMNGTDVAALTATGPALVTDTGQVLPVVVSYHALLGTLELAWADTTTNKSSAGNDTKTGGAKFLNVPAAVVTPPSLCPEEGRPRRMVPCPPASVSVSSSTSTSTSSTTGEKDHLYDDGSGRTILALTSTFADPVVLTDLRSCNPWFTVEPLTSRDHLALCAEEDGSDDGSDDGGGATTSSNSSNPSRLRLPGDFACARTTDGGGRVVIPPSASAASAGAVVVGSVRSSVYADIDDPARRGGTYSFYSAALRWLEDPDAIRPEECGAPLDADAAKSEPDLKTKGDLKSIAEKASAALREAENQLLKRYGQVVRSQFPDRVAGGGGSATTTTSLTGTLQSNEGGAVAAVENVPPPPLGAAGIVSAGSGVTAESALKAIEALSSGVVMVADGRGGHYAGKIRDLASHNEPRVAEAAKKLEAMREQLLAKKNGGPGPPVDIAELLRILGHMSEWVGEQVESNNGRRSVSTTQAASSSSSLGDQGQAAKGGAAMLATPLQPVGLLSREYVNAFESAREAWREAEKAGMHVVTGGVTAVTESLGSGSADDPDAGGAKGEPKKRRSLTVDLPSPVLRTELTVPTLDHGWDAMNVAEAIVGGGATEMYIPVYNPSGIPVRVRLAAAEPDDDDDPDGGGFFDAGNDQVHVQLPPGFVPQHLVRRNTVVKPAAGEGGGGGTTASHTNIDLNQAVNLAAQSQHQPWWTGATYTLYDDASGALLRNGHNATIRSTNGANVILVNPALHATGLLSVGCGGRRCGVRDPTAQAQRDLNAQHNSQTGQDQKAQNIQIAGENDRWFSPLGAASSVQYSPLGYKSRGSSILKGHFYESETASELDSNSKIQDETKKDDWSGGWREHASSIASHRDWSVRTDAGRTPVSNAEPPPFALPLPSQAEIVLPPFGTGRVGPLLFRPTSRGEYVANLHLENSLTGLESVKVKAKGVRAGGVAFLDADYGRESGDVEVRYGMSAVVFPGGLPPRQKKGAATQGKYKERFQAEGGRELLSRPLPGEKERTGVFRAFEVANLGDVPLRFDRVWMGGAAVDPTFSLRSNSKISNLDDLPHDKEHFPCMHGRFSTMFCGDGPVANQPDVWHGFTLAPNTSKTMYLKHEPDCGFRSEWATLNFRYSPVTHSDSASEDDDDAKSKSKRGKKRKRGRRGSSSSSEESRNYGTIQLLVGYDTTLPSAQLKGSGTDYLRCVSYQSYKSGLSSLLGMAKRLKIDKYLGLDDGDKSGDSGGWDSGWFAMLLLHTLPNAFLLWLLLLEASEVVENSVRRHLGSSSKCYKSSLTLSSDDDGGSATETAAKSDADIYLPAASSKSAAANRDLSKSDPTSSDLFNLGREQTRATVLGPYKRMGCVPVGCLLSNGGFAREKSSSGSAGGAGGSAAAGKTKDAVARGVNGAPTSRQPSGSRRRGSVQPQAAVVTLSDALFGKCTLSCVERGAHSVNSTALPCGLGWRGAAARGIKFPAAEEGEAVKELLEKRAAEKKSQREASRAQSKKRALVQAEQAKAAQAALTEAHKKQAAEVQQRGALEARIREAAEREAATAERALEKQARKEARAKEAAKKATAEKVAKAEAELKSTTTAAKTKQTNKEPPAKQQRQKEQTAEEQIAALQDLTAKEAKKKQQKKKHQTIVAASKKEDTKKEGTKKEAAPNASTKPDLVREEPKISSAPEAVTVSEEESSDHSGSSDRSTVFDGDASDDKFVVVEAPRRKKEARASIAKQAAKEAAEEAANEAAIEAAKKAAKESAKESVKESVNEPTKEATEGETLPVMDKAAKKKKDAKSAKKSAWAASGAIAAATSDGKDTVAAQKEKKKNEESAKSAAAKKGTAATSQEKKKDKDVVAAAVPAAQDKKKDKQAAKGGSGKERAAPQAAPEPATSKAKTKAWDLVPAPTAAKETISKALSSQDKPPKSQSTVAQTQPEKDKATAATTTKTSVEQKSEGGAKSEGSKSSSKRGGRRGGRKKAKQAERAAAAQASLAAAENVVSKQAKGVTAAASAREDVEMMFSGGAKKERGDSKKKPADKPKAGGKQKSQKASAADAKVDSKDAASNVPEPTGKTKQKQQQQAKKKGKAATAGSSVPSEDAAVETAAVVGGSKQPHKQLQQARQRWKLHQQKQQAQASSILEETTTSSSRNTSAGSTDSGAAYGLADAGSGGSVFTDNGLPVTIPPSSPVSKKGRNKKSNLDGNSAAPPHLSTGQRSTKVIDPGLGLPKSPAQSPIAAPKASPSKLRPPPGLAPPPGFGGGASAASSASAVVSALPMAPDVGAAENVVADFDWGGSSSALPLLPPLGQPEGVAADPIFAALALSAPIPGAMRAASDDSTNENDSMGLGFLPPLSTDTGAGATPGGKSLLATLLEENQGSMGSIGMVGGDTLIGSMSELPLSSLSPAAAAVPVAGFSDSSSGLALPPLPIGSSISGQDDATHAPLLGLGGGFNVMNFLDTILDESGQAEEEEVHEAEDAAVIGAIAVEAQAVGATAIGSIPADPWQQQLVGTIGGLGAPGSGSAIEGASLLSPESILGGGSQALNSENETDGNNNFPRSSFFKDLVSSDDEE